MRQMQTPEGKSVRLLRIGEQVRHVLAGVLGRGEVRDPVLETHIVSVSEVRVSPDLRIATAFVKALGGDDDEVLAALRRNAKFLRGEVARSMSTKYTPELKFRLDESYEEASRIDALLRDPKVARDLGDD
ncbi:30S ribosome-binding factor RbfA [Sphingosinicella sp.]|jgi:ribosome-binding factor A|uniref:30S ribosome-binding factor RbfA n=1 Tax=Sphingosinicella sp. TaxID=1917971 RepID=UPI0017EF7BDE|nr:30S ribosome-binding factor RbfA [Sphingosinicella sp.]MBA4758469.1 30S ribosome-binding factor RbfA [Sphingosinicella sp.]MEA3540246.1 30S ribosome-binding factor RbfA [Pseudomonadota bacterium]